MGNPQNRIYSCNKCGKSYSHQCSLWRHAKYECQKPPRFRCYYCSHRTHRKHNVVNHVLSLHKDQILRYYNDYSQIKFFCFISTILKFQKQNCTLVPSLNTMKKIMFDQSLCCKMLCHNFVNVIYFAIKVNILPTNKAINFQDTLN